MRYRVTGAHRETGEAVDLTLDAATPSAAEEQANQMGVMIEHIEVDAPPVAIPPPAPLPAGLVEQAAQQIPRAPSGRPVVMRPAKEVQTIEKTGKRWKLLKLVGGLSMIGGVGSCIIASAETTDPTEAGPPLISMALFFGGLAVMLFAKFGAWWHHG